MQECCRLLTKKFSLKICYLFNNETSLKDDLNDEQKKNNKPQLTLIKDNETRWNSKVKLTER